MSPCQERKLIVQAVLMALWQRSARIPVILDSDRGCQFTSEEYQRLLEVHRIICSMSAVGSCADSRRELLRSPETRPRLSTILSDKSHSPRGYL